MEADPDLIDFAEYCKSDLSVEAADFWDSLDDADKQEFLTVPVSDLANYSSVVVQEPWLVDFLSDAIAFFEFHGTWEMYLCPHSDCLRFFQDDESLITHLKFKHFPQIHPVAWPPRQHNLVEERRCADALRKMVWKPIVVEAGLDLLLAMCHDDQYVTMAYECAGSDWLYSLNWLYSEDPERKRLLAELEKGLQVLLAEHKQASFSLLSDGYFTKMTALASKQIFVCRPSRYNMQFLQGLIARSPLSFCLLEAADLNRFVKLVETMCQFTQQTTLPLANPESEFGEGDVSWNKSEILDILSFSPNESLSVFPKAEPLCNGEGVSIFSLLCRGPCIPVIPRVPSKANESFFCVNEVMNELRECQAQTAAGPNHQISLNQTWPVWLQTWHRVYGLKHQNLVPLDNPWDFLPPFMGENFNPSWTILRLWNANFCSCFGGHAKADCIESQFQSEQNHLQLVNRVLCLGSQLRKLCALDCRMYILPLMQSFLRLKLYFNSRCHRLKVREDNPAPQCPMKPYQEEEYTEQQVSYEEGESESDSYDDSDLCAKPWRDNRTLRILDSTMSESVTGETEGSGPFFWMAISDVLRHCEKDRRWADRSVREGIRWFRLNKTWKYWVCYDCNSTFIDRESHMVHLENEHRLSIGHNECWLIPQQGSRDEEEEFKQDAVKRESGLEDSITLDHTYNYFLVDSRKYYGVPSANEEKELERAKRRLYLEIVDNLKNRLSHLVQLVQIKRDNLKYLKFVNALGVMLLNGDQPLSHLVSRLRKLSTADWPIGSSNFSSHSMKANNFHQLQFQFLSQLLNQAHGQQYGTLSNCSMLDTFEDMKLDLIFEICLTDQIILRAVDQIDKMKCCLSNLCVCDYRTEIVPPVRSFLHATFKFDDSLRSLECNNVKKFLSTFDLLLVEDRAYSFKVALLSPGRVIINAMENKSSWAFAFIGIRLSFVGEWFRVAVAGIFNFGWWSSWGAGSNGWSGCVVPGDSAVITDWHGVDDVLCGALSDALRSLVLLYGEQIWVHGNGMSTD